MPSHTTITSRADVPTAKPDRYAKQLVSHLGRKIEFVDDGGCWTAALGGGTARTAVGDGVLTLLAAGDDEQAVGLLEEVLGSHLQRFGSRDDLTVAWTRTTAPPVHPGPVRDVDAGSSPASTHPPDPRGGPAA